MAPIKCSHKTRKAKVKDQKLKELLKMPREIQYNRMKGKVRGIKVYRQRLLKEIKDHVKTLENINSIIICGNFN